MRALVLSGGAAHGAFQAGAIEAVYEMGWIPDIVCGSSVGAINAVGLAAGKSPEHLSNIWRSVRNEDVYRWRRAHDWITFWRWSSLLDTSPLRRFLSNHIVFEDLRKSSQVVTCFSVDVLSGRLRGYINRLASCTDKFHKKYRPRLLDIDAVMASTAIPLVFPWVRNEWDGSLLQYAPLKPAVLLGATEIVVVSLEIYQPDPALPRGPLQTALRILDVISQTRLRTDLAMLLDRNENPKYRKIDVHVISPSRLLGYSKLNFSSPEKESAIRHGRNRAYQVLNNHV